MSEYTGRNMVLEFETNDISDQARRVVIDEAADAPEDIDVTHKGDTERQLIDGLPGAVKTTVTIEALDESGGVGDIMALVLNTTGTLNFYPNGKVEGEAEGVLNNATLRSRNQTVAYDDATTVTAVFESKQSVTWGTYNET